jgi:ATP-binding cassette subfamily B protein
LDGVDIAAMSRAELRANIGMVLPGHLAVRRHDRREHRVRCGRPDPGADHRGGPGGARRPVHPDPAGRVRDAPWRRRGANVSAGEKQLITIARAFLSQPSILVLDEATSSVDTRTEVLIQRADELTALRPGPRSSSPHRLSTIRDADVILVMEHGQIVEMGNHETLLAAGGRLRPPVRRPVRPRRWPPSTDGAGPPPPPIGDVKKVPFYRGKR